MNKLEDINLKLKYKATFQTVKNKQTKIEFGSHLINVEGSTDPKKYLFILEKLTGWQTPHMSLCNHIYA